MESRLLYVLLLYFVYLQYGAMIFYILESQNVLRLTEYCCRDDDIINALLAANFTNDDILAVENETETAIGGPDRFGDAGGTRAVWDVYNSFFFSLSLITTIGYGNVTPATDHGVVFCLLYVVLGIPLNMAIIGDLSELHGKRFKKLLSDPVLLSIRSSFLRIFFRLWDFFHWIALLIWIPALNFMYTEDWTFLEAGYYGFITLTTVGFGDYVAGSTLPMNVGYGFYKLFLFLWILCGVPYMGLLSGYIAHYLILHFSYAFVWDERKAGFVNIRFAEKRFTYHQVFFHKEVLETWRQIESREKASISILIIISLLERIREEENLEFECDLEDIEDVESMIKKVKAEREREIEKLRNRKRELLLQSERQRLARTRVFSA